MGIRGLPIFRCRFKSASKVAFLVALYYQLNFTGGPQATVGHQKYSSILEKFYQCTLSKSAFSVSISGQHLLRHQEDIKRAHQGGSYNSKTSLSAQVHSCWSTQ